MSNHNEISSFIWNVCDDILRNIFNKELVIQSIINSKKGNNSRI